MNRLKIEYGDIYVQIPDDDVEAIELAIEVLDFFIERAEKRVKRDD